MYKTTDYGKTWTKIVNGIPNDHFTRTIREDPNRKGLMFAGTEFGIYVSYDAGDHWQSIQLNLPIVPITGSSTSTSCQMIELVNWSQPAKAARSGSWTISVYCGT